MSAATETPKDAARRLSAYARQSGYQPAGLHCYHDAEGEPAFWRIRCKHPDTADKWIRPMRWDGSNYVLGEPTAPPEGKPLYRLPELLAADPASPVWIVEGEPCADALAKLGLVVTTSGAADSAGAADWTPMRGRSAIHWPDHDSAGTKYAADVTDRLRALGCEVQRLDVAALGLPSKGDCVDWLREYPDATVGDVLSLPRVAHAISDRDSRDSLDTAAADDGAPRVILLRGSDVMPESVDWLWPGWLAAGKLHLIGGQPGTGKTTIATALAATVTQGGRWPDGSRAARGSVAVWSGEDDITDTLAPRLLAAGADMGRVHLVSGIREKGVRYPFDPATDTPLLADALAGIPDLRLLVVDPIVSAVSGDSHKNAEVRRGLQPLVDLAQQHRCALLGVTHLSKGTGGREPVERITGSLAFAALARLVLMTTKQEADGDRPERRVLLRAKSNIGPDGGGFAYDLQQGDLDGYPGVSASRAIWGEAIAGSARELLAEAEAVDGERSATDEAMDWLRYVLEAGPLIAGDVLKQARDAGVSEKAVRSARERLGVKPQKSGLRGGWLWELPKMPKMPKMPEGAHSQSMGILGGGGHLGEKIATFDSETEGWV